MEEDTFIAFAYGSNMSTARLRERCPSAKPLGVAELIGFELRWHKRSADGSGKCDIVAGATPETRVLGVLYEIASKEKSELDRAEGLGNGYAEIEVEVISKGSPARAKAYQATAVQQDPIPYSWYRELVVAGAKEHGLPAAYIAQLEAIPAKEDPDRERHKKNMSLIPGTRA